MAAETGRVLFVCSGNTCRSPMAAAVAREAGVEAESAGIDAAAGDGAAPNAERAARDAGLDLSDHTPTGVDAVDLGAFDVIVALDPSVAQALRRRYDVEDRLVTWSVADPYGRSLADYRLCLHEIQQSVDVSALGR